MERFFGLIGILVIFLIAFLMSNNKKLINIKTVGMGFLLQILLAVFVLKTPVGQAIFYDIGLFIQKILQFSNQGAAFLFGPLSDNIKLGNVFGKGSIVFAVQLLATTIFVSVIVNILYYYKIMQRVIAILSKGMYKLMNVSGAESFSNVASAFVGQIMAQIMIKPYLPNLTRSELLASMTGSMACISGAVMAIYIGMGIPAQYLLAASIMAAPGALVISKIVYPEDGTPQTQGEVKISKRRTHVNVVDSIARGASDGFSVALKVFAVLIAFVALIAMIDWLLGKTGIFLHNALHINLSFIGLDIDNLSMKAIVGKLFGLFAYVMGVPLKDSSIVGSLMGTKFILNEMLGYIDLISVKNLIADKSFIIASFALCGFANISSIAIQIGGIGEIAPNQRKNISRLGLRALICGTLASYMSACIAGILLG
ncbi:MAG TPA: nucleoside transporter C-terminal domain-containing protein [Candidatus Gastranaerophilaceae bacterium]|nr:nucleoside transporter C-terminal domain-containing protein [Candidatus Gastranaerophilaceae bacterium]